MLSPEECLNRNFDIICRLFALIGQNVLDRNFRPSWRTVWSNSVVLFAYGELLYLMTMERSNLVVVLEVLQTFLFGTQGVQNVMLCTMRSRKILAVRTRLSEIQVILAETKDNGPIICKNLQLSHLLQKLLFVLYTTAAVLVLLIPIFLWLILGKKILLFAFFVPSVDESTTEGFLMTVALHIFIMPVAFCVYTTHECLFLAFIMPIGAYVNAFGNEITELNSMLKLQETNGPAIADKLDRIQKLHQLLIEYETMLEDLYKFFIMNKIGLVYLGIISTVLLILISNDPMAYIFCALQIVQLTQSCLMGTIITVKNEQLLNHIYDINWYRMSTAQAKKVAFMLHKAQNPTDVTIGKFAPLNVETYKSLVNSIYSYVMVLITIVE